MTAALRHLAGPALRPRFGRLATVLAVVLPVPLLAALGLSLPLPATVERLAAKLVPFGDSSVLDAKRTRALARGSIVLAPGERDNDHAASTASSESPGSPLPTGIGGKPATPNGSQSTISEPRGQTSHDGVQKNEAGPTASASAPSGPAPSNGGEPVPDPGETQPGSDPSPTPEPEPKPTQVVDAVTDTANGAVAPITNTVTNATSSVTETAQDTVDTGTGALGGITPP